MINSSTAVVESTDSCRSRTVNKNLVGSVFFMPHAASSDFATQLPSALTDIDEKVLASIRKYDVILIDTCELMSHGLKHLFNLYAESWRADNITLSITPSVMMELFRNCAHINANTRQDALDGWQLIGSPEYRNLFTTYPPSSINTHADPNLLDAARTLKFKHEKNVLILTSDKSLTSSIFNTCCTKSLISIGGEVQALYIDKQTGKLTRYHESRLEKLTGDAILPEWHLIGKPSVKPRSERYFHDAIFNASVIIDSYSLKHMLGIDGSISMFMQNLETKHALRPGQKFTVLSTSLLNTKIFAAVASMPHLFNVIQAAHPLMEEEDALYQAILDMTASSQDKHILLISNKINRYDAIIRRLPTCHRIKEVWGCYIEPTTGYLLQSSRKEASSFIAA